MGDVLGYARASTTDEDAAMQIDALNLAGCGRIFVDTVPGSRDQRPEFERLMKELRPHDTLVVWRLDRLGRSTIHLTDQLQILRDRGVGFRSLQETIDTTSSSGQLIFHVFAALAQFEQDLIRERLTAARARGGRSGRPPYLSADQVKTARRMYEQQSDMTVAQIATVLGVSRNTIYRALKRDADSAGSTVRSRQKRSSG